MEQTTPTIIVRVHRPELTAEERARRMDRIKAAAAEVVKAAHIIHSKACEEASA